MLNKLPLTLSREMEKDEIKIEIKTRTSAAISQRGFFIYENKIENS